MIFNLKGKGCGNGALWKREGRLDKEILFHRAWKKGRNVEIFFKVLELLEVVQFKVSHIAKVAPSLFPHSHTTTTTKIFIVSSSILLRRKRNENGKQKRLFE